MSDELKIANIPGMRNLTASELAEVEAFREKMRREVIPQIIDILQQREKAGAANKDVPLYAAPVPAIPHGYRLVPISRSYEMRAAAFLHFNTAEQAGKDRDDAMEAAWIAQLAAAPQSTVPQDAKDAELYRKLRAMHWNDGKLAVIDAKDLPLGVQTYSGEMLDAFITAQRKENDIS